MTSVIDSPAAHTHVGGRTTAAPATHLHPAGSADLADHPVSQGREEVWRFTPLRRLRGLHDDAPLSGDAYRFDVEAPDGVTVSTVAGSEADVLRGSTGYRPTDRPAARGWNASDMVTVVDVPAHTAPVDRTRLLLRDAGSGVAGHVLIRVGRQAKAQIVLVYEGSAELIDTVEVDLADGADATVVAVFDGAADAVHLATHHLRVGRDARVKHVALSFGGDLVRLTTTVDYAGPGGDAELLGLTFADAGQHLEQRLFVDHDQPHCKSRVLYKGALQGSGAHTVWVGDVLIRKTAEGTDTYEMNRNLLLTDGARADSVPNLEIETGEIVGAGHASATGRFDDEQMFYLLSRGIPEAAARRLVVRGFFAEVLQRIGIESVYERTWASIERELAIAGY